MMVDHDSSGKEHRLGIMAASQVGKEEGSSLRGSRQTGRTAMMCSPRQGLTGDNGFLDEESGDSGYNGKR